MLSPVKIWRNQKNIAEKIGLSGKIISWTLVRVPPANFAPLAPYPVVLVELLSGKRLTCQLVDYDTDDLAAGRQVEIVLRRITEPTSEGIIPYGFKAKPV